LRVIPSSAPTMKVSRPTILAVVCRVLPGSCGVSRGGSNSYHNQT
jgi:hypothetical protein